MSNGLKFSTLGASSCPVKDVFICACCISVLPKQQSHQSFLTARSSLRLVPSPESTDAANTSQTSPPTHTAAESPPHSSGKTSAAPSAAHAPAQHPLRRANASKRKAAPSPKHPQSLPPAVPVAPGS